MEEKSKKKKRDKKNIILKEPTRKYVCVICPNCCELETDGSNTLGAKCEKGEAFACQEWVQPLRVLTTTVRCETEKGVRVLPVKTAFPVPLSRVSPIMKEIKALRLSEVPPIGSKLTVENLTEPLDLVVAGE
jgi:CxxC motif-containing protein